MRAQLTSFVGREDDVARVLKALGQYRLVTLVGPGGTGKTRLAAEVAAVAAVAAAGGSDGTSADADDVSDGVWLAELASVTDPADVPQSVLNSIGLREPRLLLDGPQRAGNRDARTRLLDGLADAHALLVLDNCEHLIDACAHLADELLSHCPGLRIVATSREPLGITGESLLSIAPLSQPMPGVSAQEAVGFPAVRLFAERAAAVSPGFEVTDETVALVIDIVRRLDGLPLAIELAAARLRTLPLAEIARRLNDRFRLLTGGSRTALPRHRTLRAVVEWSWDLLTPEERLLAERFAVFPAGATPDAVAVVCAGPGGPATGAVRATVDPADVDDLLSSLVDKSLLQPVREAPGEAAREAGGTRLRMLETVREYGSEQLAGRGELGGAAPPPRRALLRPDGRGGAAAADQGPGDVAAGGEGRPRQHPGRAALLVRRRGRVAGADPRDRGQRDGDAARQLLRHHRLGRPGPRGAGRCRRGRGPAHDRRGAVPGQREHADVRADPGGRSAPAAAPLRRPGRPTWPSGSTRSTSARNR